MAKVLRPFYTATRRFNVGADVEAKDIDGPISFEDRQERGEISKEAPADLATVAEEEVSAKPKKSK